MPPTPPPPIAPSPPAPDRADRNTFSSRATAWSDWLKNNAVGEIAAVATNAYSNAVDAYTSSVNAASSATAAAQSALASATSATATAAISRAALWIDGATYAAPDCAISRLNYQTYRKKTPSSATPLDPAIDQVNWVQLGGNAPAAAISLNYTTNGVL